MFTRLIERRMEKFLRAPVSVRSAANVIVVATFVVVLVSGALMRFLDHSEFHSFGLGLWWSVQTVTTVGYGDITPAHVTGRIVAAFVMLWGIAFLSVVVAAITSSFVARATRLTQRQGAVDAQHFDRRLDELQGRLDRIEQLLSQQD